MKFVLKIPGRKEYAKQNLGGQRTLKKREKIQKRIKRIKKKITNFKKLKQKKKKKR